MRFSCSKLEGGRQGSFVRLRLFHGSELFVERDKPAGGGCEKRLRNRAGGMGKGKAGGKGNRNEQREEKEDKGSFI